MWLPYTVMAGVFFVTFAALCGLVFGETAILKITAAAWISGVITFSGMVEIGGLTVLRSRD